MTNAHPTRLALRLLSVRPHLTLTEIALVESALLYRRVDGRDHVPSEVRAVRPSAADWARLRLVLDEARFWSWPRRWSHVHDGYEGEFAVAITWGGRAAMSAGPIGAAPEVGAVLDVVSRMACGARFHVVSCGGAACQPLTRLPTTAPERQGETPEPVINAGTLIRPRINP